MGRGGEEAAREKEISIYVDFLLHMENSGGGGRQWGETKATHRWAWALSLGRVRKRFGGPIRSWAPSQNSVPRASPVLAWGSMTWLVKVLLRSRGGGYVSKRRLRAMVKAPRFGKHAACAGETMQKKKRCCS